MDVLICRTADYSRMVVMVDGVVTMDSGREGLIMHDEVALVEVYAREGANITLASLPPGAQMVF